MSWREALNDDVAKVARRERWEERVKLLEGRAEAARAVLDGAAPCPPIVNDRIGRASAAVETAARVAEHNYPPYASAHEAYGVLVEEVAEFFDEVRKKSHLRSKLAMKNEAIDIGAVALRIVALCEEGGPW